MASHKIVIGDIRIEPQVENDCLISLGSVLAKELPLRASAARFLPWFDSFQGDVFPSFRFNGITKLGSRTTIELAARASMDYPFREKRDSSGDPCLRDVSWDAPAPQATIRVCFEPAEDVIDGHRFIGFKYWFEGDSPAVKIHRFLDRQTWELGGSTDGVSLILRNWLTPPRVALNPETAYSTAGFEHVIGCMPGNLWARWSLLPSFDLQCSRQGVLLAYFDRVSLIRTVIEKSPNERSLRCLDMHLFESTNTFTTNPKTVLYSADKLDPVDLLNLWTCVHDRERDKARQQFGMKPEQPAQLSLCHNVWLNIHFDTTYNDVIDLASEVDADNVMIDPIWESGQTVNDETAALKPLENLGHASSVLAKVFPSNQCAVMDWEVDCMRGGEKALKQVCDYAAGKGINILSWIATHMAPYSRWRHNISNKGMGVGAFGVFATRESGCHPDTGYAGDCWALNLLTPMKDYVTQRVMDICAKTGLKGFLWDSFSNLGWWQLSYADGTCRPQFAEMASMYAAFANAGLYLMPEAITTFSSHSCLGLHGGDMYTGDDMGYSYDTAIHCPINPATQQAVDCDILRGKLPIDTLFRYLSHRRAPNLSMSLVPKEERCPKAIAQIREIFTAYRKVRNLMHKRTILKDGQGVLWDSADGLRQVLFTYAPITVAKTARDVILEQVVRDAPLKPNRVYVLE